MLIQEILVLLALSFDSRAECGEALRVRTNVVKRLDSCLGQAAPRISDEVVNKAVQHALESFVEFELVRSLRIDLDDFAIEAIENRNAFADLVQGEKVSLVSVVEVSSVVSDLVRKVDQLSFERRSQVEKVFAQLGMLLCTVIARVLDDAFADFEGEVQSAHGGVESFFPGVPEGRVPDVVHQR